MLEVQNLQGEYIGSYTVYVGVNIVVKRGTPIEEADRIAKEVRKKVHQTI